MSGSLSVRLAVVAFLACASPAAAQISAPGATGTEPIAFSISGGISLGAYQAGVNWALLEVFRRAAADSTFAKEHGVPKYQLQSISGASAGNINTLLWAVEACTRSDSARPAQESLLWQVWTSIGLNNLMPRRNTGDLSLLDRSFMDTTVIPMIAKRFNNADLYEGCTVPAGITLTRLKPGSLWLKTPDAQSWRPRVRKDSLKVATQRYTTFFKAEVHAGEMKFRSPAGEHVSIEQFGKLIYLPTRSDNSDFIDHAHLFKAVKASSAFPVAFQPIELQYVDARQPEVTDTALFMDGGAFDNNPVSLALELHERYSGADGRRPIDLVYVSPLNLRGGLLHRDTTDKRVALGGIGSMATFLGGFVNTARQYELQMLTRDKALAERIPHTLLFTSRHSPIFGTHLSAFGAFIAQPFREYDFYVGAYDGLYAIARNYGCLTERELAKGAEECIRDPLVRLLQSGAVNLGHAGATVVDLAFRREFQQPLLASKASSGAEGDELEQIKARAFVGFERALVKRQAELKASTEETEHSCGGLAYAATIMCLDGLRAIAHDLRLDGDVAAFNDYLSRCATCDQALPRLLAKPDREAEAILESFVARLGWIEQRIRDEHDHASAYSGLTALTYWVYRATAVPFKGRDLDPSSTPDRLHWFSLVPFYVGINLGSSGHEVRWRPTWHFGPRMSVAVPLLLHRNNGGPALDHANFAGIGTSLLYRPTSFKKRMTLSEFGLAAHRWHQFGTDEWFWEAEINARVVAGLLQFGLRYQNSDVYMHGDGRWGVSVGISNLNGIIYLLSGLGNQ